MILLMPMLLLLFKLKEPSLLFISDPKIPMLIQPFPLMLELMMMFYSELLPLNSELLTTPLKDKLSYSKLLMN